MFDELKSVAPGPKALKIYLVMTHGRFSVCTIFWISPWATRVKRRCAVRHHKSSDMDDVKSATSTVLLLLLLTSAAPTRALAGDDPLVDMVRLYGAAAYAETLANLDRLDYQMFGAQIDEYRALCFLALDRELEAQSAIESLVIRHPQPLDDIAARSPKFAALYQSVRKRVIPSIANAVYSRGKASLERQNYEEAAAAFAEASTLASGEGLDSLSDLRMLADEFKSLSEQQMHRALVPELPDAVLATALPMPSLPPPPPPPEFLPIARVYGPDDNDVKAPSVLDQTLPTWIPPTALVKSRAFHGVLKVVIGEDGSVAAAEIVQPSFLWYDEQLLKAARHWRYRPAMKGNHAVQYRRVIEFTLRSNSSS
jgi:TonB family protein